MDLQWVHLRNLMQLCFLSTSCFCSNAMHRLYPIGESPGLCGHHIFRSVPTKIWSLHWLNSLAEINVVLCDNFIVKLPNFILFDAFRWFCKFCLSDNYFGLIVFFFVNLKSILLIPSLCIHSTSREKSGNLLTVARRKKSQWCDRKCINLHFQNGWQINKTW